MPTQNINVKPTRHTPYLQLPVRPALPELLLCQPSDGHGRGLLHFVIHARGAAVDGPPEDVREGAHVVDLVGKVAAPWGKGGVWG